MRTFLRPLLGAGATARHRVITAVVATAAAIAMLSGVGQRFLDSHSNLADADHLAALSLVMAGAPGDAIPVTFLDVDDRTRLAWGATVATPHAPLGLLVRQAADSGAAGILVDFDLTPMAVGAPADPAFMALLQDYPDAAPPLMLVRKIHFERVTGGDGANALQAAAALPTPYDGAAAGKANIRWVTTLNDVGKDRSVRRIKLWQTVCEGASGKAYPAPALVMAAYTANEVRDLVGFLESRVAVECGHATMPDPVWPPVRDDVAQLPYVFTDSAEQPALFRIFAGGKETVALRRISAALLVRYDNGSARPAGEIDRDPFAGRVVIIGASYTESGDTYETPFGIMPGALVLANSVVQARAIVETVPASMFAKNALAMLLFLLLAYIARTFIGAAAIVILAVVTLAALFGLSRWLGFSAGIDVISVAVPGFALFKLIDSAIFIAQNIPGRGWRALLKNQTPGSPH